MLGSCNSGWKSTSSVEVWQQPMKPKKLGTTYVEQYRAAIYLNRFNRSPILPLSVERN